MDKEAVSYMLELQDSTGKVIDAVKQGVNKIPRGKEDFSMPLGLLEKHTIRARFGLPVRVFLYDEWPMVLFLVASAWMLGLIFYWQHYLVHKEKRIRQHEELNISDCESRYEVTGWNCRDILGFGGPGGDKRFDFATAKISG